MTRPKIDDQIRTGLGILYHCVDRAAAKIMIYTWYALDKFGSINHFAFRDSPTALCGALIHRNPPYWKRSFIACACCERLNAELKQKTPLDSFSL